MNLLTLALLVVSCFQPMHGKLYGVRPPCFWYFTLRRLPTQQMPMLPSSCVGEVLPFWNKLPYETKGNVRTALASLTAGWFGRAFLLEPRYIPTWSMFPTFEAGDYVLFDKVSHLFRGYRKRDVVLFRATIHCSAVTNTTDMMVKRIVAAAGDGVEVRNGHLYINGIVQKEGYIHGPSKYSIRSTKVPSGMVMVLGDNRDNSYDSHVWGFLPTKQIVGRAVLRYWPPWRMGTIEGCS